MRITRKLVIGFLAVSLLALPAVLAGSWRSSGADTAHRTRHTTDPRDTARSARTGDVVCFDGDLSRRRPAITRGGTAREPITYSGGGAAVHGITVEADHVVAIGLADHSTGAPIGRNTLDPGIGYEVGVDASSRPGYEGPEPGGAP
ncbi:hypothetical protein HUT19_36700 [Streptomyces sp. NA02950]|uniref:hypothetical protein n=1 Tax=Streptomyces sp. NA02950 TaxID=2742137 RepID=UPI00159157B7|nr:hypothetical protein [Streptomyces sp. NA02950]QKV96555.1 hypothetical protein HUT19_36700 [Streptomyces sp. NA02950]